MKFTTCITNWSRINQLKGCIESLRPHEGLMDISVACFGATPEHRKVCRELLPAGSAVHFNKGDDGCNKLWIKAIENAKTKWISILHDDDRRPPGFAAEVNKLIHQAELNSCGFVVWNGSQLNLKTGDVFGQIQIMNQKDGVYPSEPYLKNLKQHNTYPFSPVAFLYDRETALDALYWCEEHLADVFTKPAMMIGNDIMLNWAHCKRYNWFLQSSKALSMYGHWEESETCMFVAGKNQKLMKCYDIARDRLPEVIPTREKAVSLRFKGKFVHVWSDYLAKPCDPESERRNAFARSTWETVYSSGNWIPHRIESVPRTSQTQLGDERDIPFVKDMFQQACDLVQESDIIVFSNADIAFVPDIESQIKEAVTRVGCCYAARWNVPRFTKPLTTAKELRQGEWYAGTDLLAFTKKWWIEHGDEFPDMLLACEFWDLVIRNLMKIHGGLELCDAIYHETHKSWWYRPENFRKNVGNLYNKELSEKFFNERRKDGADPLDWKKDEERRLQAKTVANNGGNIPDFTVDARTGRVTWNRYVPLSQRIVRL